MTKIIQFEDSIIIIDPEAEIQPGDLYIAQRNTGWKLLTCDHVDKIYGLVIAQDPLAYAFNISECKKVLEIT